MKLEQTIILVLSWLTFILPLNFCEYVGLNCNEPGPDYIFSMCISYKEMTKCNVIIDNTCSQENLCFCQAQNGSDLPVQYPCERFQCIWEKKEEKATQIERPKIKRTDLVISTTTKKLQKASSITTTTMTTSEIKTTTITMTSNPIINAAVKEMDDEPQMTSLKPLVNFIFNEETSYSEDYGSKMTLPKNPVNSTQKMNNQLSSIEELPFSENTVNSTGTKETQTTLSKNKVNSKENKETQITSDEEYVLILVPLLIVVFILILIFLICFLKKKHSKPQNPGMEFTTIIKKPRMKNT